MSFELIQRDRVTRDEAAAIELADARLRAARMANTAAKDDGALVIGSGERAQAENPTWTARLRNGAVVRVGTPEHVRAYEELMAAQTAKSELLVHVFVLNNQEMHAVVKHCEAIGMCHFEQADDRPSFDDAELAQSWVPDGVSGICGWKLCSNDQWYVTPEECRQALERWEAQPEWAESSVADVISFWPNWIAWLERCVDRNGFDVR